MKYSHVFSQLCRGVCPVLADLTGQVGQLLVLVLEDVVVVLLRVILAAVVVQAVITLLKK